MTQVVFCLPGRTFSYKFVLSWSNLLNSCVPTFQVIPLVRMASANNIYHVRDLCLGGDKNGPADQKPFAGRLNYDYIMWLDSDSIFTPQHFKTLLDHIQKNPKIHILSGLYLLDESRYSAHYLPTQKRDYLTPTDIKNLSGSDPFKVLYSGMGFMLVRRGVFESLPFPWFAPFTYPGPGGASILAGDDASFCQKAATAGFATWVDPQVIIDHEKPQLLKPHV